MKRKSSELFMSFCWVKVSRFEVDREQATQYSRFRKGQVGFSLEFWCWWATFRCRCRASWMDLQLCELCVVLGEQIDLKQAYYVRNLNRWCGHFLIHILYRTSLACCWCVSRRIPAIFVSAKLMWLNPLVSHEPRKKCKKSTILRIKVTSKLRTRSQFQFCNSWCNSGNWRTSLFISYFFFVVRCCTSRMCCTHSS